MRIARDIKRGLLLRNSTRDETHKTRTGLGPDLVMHKIICTGLRGSGTLTLPGKRALYFKLNHVS